jgi:hypothetical protein
MRQTVELEGGRKATVDIPYSRFAGTGQQFQRMGHEGQCCESKVVLLNYGGCSGGTRSSTFDMKTVIADLEDSYDRDVSALEQRASRAEKERDSLVAAHTSAFQTQKHSY